MSHPALLDFPHIIGPNESNSDCDGWVVTHKKMFPAIYRTPFLDVSVWEKGLFRSNGIM